MKNGEGKQHKQTIRDCLIEIIKNYLEDTKTIFLKCSQVQATSRSNFNSFYFPSHCKLPSSQKLVLNKDYDMR